MNNITIFGGTGDLCYRKLMPALYNLFTTDKLGESDRVLAIGRRDYTDEEYINIVKKWVVRYSRIEFKEEHFLNFAKRIEYFRMDFTKIEEYSRLSEKYCSSDINESLFYFAVAPEFFEVITEGIITLNCSGKPKLVIEKPFGETPEHAERLNNRLEELFGAESIYRIDHYLGKEMIQNILTIRFQNLLFENSWNRNNIDNIRIIANEEVGVETRAKYYDNAGALKDMVQNHLMQLLSFVAMEPPTDADDLKSKQSQVFHNLRPAEKLNIEECLLLARYDGYLTEPDVPATSTTETFAACKLYVDNERWQDVPFYIITGKKMATREMNVIVTFKKLPLQEKPNVLVFKIQPYEGVTLAFNIKTPGDSYEITGEEMDFCQNCNLSYRMNTPEAYERLLYSAIIADRRWFSGWDQIYISWRYIEKIKQLYHEKGLPIFGYKAGSTGPIEISKILKGTDTTSYSQLYCNVK